MMAFASTKAMGLNLFAYCENDFVNDYDNSGMLSVSSVIRFVKTIGYKVWGIIKNIWDAFSKPDAIYLKPFEIVIDVCVGIMLPSFSAALKVLTYKAVSRELVQQAFKNAGYGFINMMAKFGIKVSLNTLVAASVNNLIFKHASRFLTVGGIICLILDVLDLNVDHYLEYKKIFA